MDQHALRRVNGTNIVVVRGDLTRQPVEAVVNAANSHLQHGGGVARAIIRTGGRVIQEESDDWIRANGPLKRGEAAVTTGGMLIASHVIHVAGPRYMQGEDNEGMLRDATYAALDAAAAHDIKSIAIPAISAGIFGYPPDEATRVITEAVMRWLVVSPHELVEIRLVGFSAEITRLFATALATEPAA